MSIPKYAGWIDPISKEKPSKVCPDCKYKFTSYYYRLHRGPSYDEKCDWIMSRTRISAPAPQPPKDEILEALSKMTLKELEEFRYKLRELVDKKKREQRERGIW